MSFVRFSTAMWKILWNLLRKRISVIIAVCKRIDSSKGNIIIYQIIWTERLFGIVCHVVCHIIPLYAIHFCKKIQIEQNPIIFEWILLYFVIKGHFKKCIEIPHFHHTFIFRLSIPTSAFGKGIDKLSSQKNRVNSVSSLCFYFFTIYCFKQCHNT